MKRLVDEISLHGKLETITVMDFRKRPGEVFTSVALGKMFVVTRNGKAVAVVAPLPGGLTIAVGRDGTVSYTR